MVLHIFSRNLGHKALMEQCLRLAADDDAILLIEDGVAWGTDAYLAGQAMENTNLSVYVLQEDLRSRGLEELMRSGVKPVNYEGFVELTERYSKSVSWF